MPNENEHNFVNVFTCFFHRPESEYLLDFCIIYCAQFVKEKFSHFPNFPFIFLHLSACLRFEFEFSIIIQC